MRQGPITTPHTHWCPYCRQQVDCHAAHNGGCLFAATAPMSCNPCAAKMWPLERAQQQELFE